MYYSSGYLGIRSIHDYLQICIRIPTCWMGRSVRIQHLMTSSRAKAVAVLCDFGDEVEHSHFCHERACAHAGNGPDLHSPRRPVYIVKTVTGGMETLGCASLRWPVCLAPSEYLLGACRAAHT